MTSCLGTSIVTTRKSIRTIRSTIGMSNTTPGPLAPINLPSRKMTPRSYSRNMRTADGNRINAKNPSGISQTSKLNNRCAASITLAFRFHLQRQATNRDDFHRLPGLNRNVAQRIPIFAIDKDTPGLGVDPRQCSDSFANHRFRASFDRQKLRAQSRRDYENEKTSRQQRPRQDELPRQPQRRFTRIEQHERPQQKRDDPSSRQHSMSRRENVRYEKSDCHYNQRYAGNVDRQHRAHIKNQ